MATFSSILEDAPNLSALAKEWLNQLVGDWQLIADIAFADLVLYLREGPSSYAVVAQTRPATAATLFDTDLVGEPAEREVIEMLEAVAITGEQLATEDDDSIDTWVPVRVDGEVIAVLRVSAALVPDRVPTQTHEHYEIPAALLLEMVQNGEFPIDDAPSSYRHGTPRVADGVVVMDADGMVLYASPNAVSNFRKYGVYRPLVGNALAELVAELIDEFAVPDETLPVVLLGKAAWLVELEARDIVLSMRAVPLRHEGKRVAALLLCRDVTRMRRDEREIMSKDATIKEINHRVKNNLQTVSALLRLQARRAVNEETRAALAGAQRRVEMIAIVHERLSQTINEVVEFDEVFGSLLRTVRDVAVTDSPVDIVTEGSFGLVRAEQATALVVGLNEIISNSVEHGLAGGGHIVVRAQRSGDKLVVEVEDDGEGLGGNAPTPGLSSLSRDGVHQRSGLGTQIVRTLVASDLHGKIMWGDVDPHGTVVHLEAQLRRS